MSSVPCKTNTQSASSARPEWWVSATSSFWKIIPGLRSPGLPPATARAAKRYGEAVKWRLDTPLPDRIANMPVSPADPAGAPHIIFASVDAAFARELEPKFADAGCAVLSNSSAFRMAANVPLVIPEVNADHLHLIEEQDSRKRVGRLHGHQSQLLDHRLGDGSQAPAKSASASSRSSSPPCRP